MEDAIKVLLAEDLSQDVELIEKELQQMRLHYRLQTASSRAAYEAGLKDFSPDLILSNYSLPDFDGLTALRLAQQLVPGTPVIIVTRSLNELIAVDCMKAGALDYVIKEHLERLEPAITRALAAQGADRSRSQTEAALRESRRTLATLLSYLPGMAYRCRNDRDWTTEFVSHGGQELTGCPSGDPVNNCRLSYNQLIHIEDREKAWHEIKAALNQKQPFQLQYRIQTAHGALKWVWEQGRGVYDAQGELQAVEGFIMDVTARHETEERLQQSEARYRCFTEAAFEGISMVYQGRLLDASPTYAAMYGYKLEEMIGHSLAKWTAPEFIPSVMKRIEEGDESPYEVKGVRKDGTTFLTEVRGRNLVYQGKPVRVAAVRDITDRMVMENQLRQSQKMESVGLLAAGVAHDFNNVLTIIQGYAGLLLRDPKLAPEITESLKHISAAAGRAANLTRQLLTFSRRQIMQFCLLDLNEVVEHVARMLTRLIGEQITLEFHCEPHLPAIHADMGMMEQIIINLAVNAREAMAAGGKLSISTSVKNFQAADIRNSPDAMPGQFVCLRVGDTGCGMDKATMDRIFEPFFTTKGVGQGTGLGLATVYGIVKQHHGWVEVESQVGKGAVFQVYLPATSQPVSNALTEGAPDDMPTGKETILLVEDEPGVRTMVRRTLRYCGYQVLESSNGVTAWKLWKGQRDKIDLVMTDVILPEGLSGRELAQKMHKESPALKIIYTSGYSVDLTGADFALQEGINFLQKPYQPQTLARMIRTCLDEK